MTPVTYMARCRARFGGHPRPSLIVFTLDASTYSRELAPLAGHYPVLKLGPAWWFHDCSPSQPSTPHPDNTPDTAAVSRAVAERFVAARLSARSLPGYPGPPPKTLAEAYARQDAAISLWPDDIAGWKIGGIADSWAARLGEPRLLGPIFRRCLWRARADGVNSATHRLITRRPSPSSA